MLRNLWNAGKCKLGFHAGEWTYDAAGACAQARTCENCQKVQQRTEHTWGEWAYVAEGVCDLTRSCARCSEAEQQTEHSWGEARFRAPDRCERLIPCQRCGAEEEAAPEHAWVWVLQDEGGCTEVQRCDRCRTAGDSQRAVHAWGDWSYSVQHGAPAHSCGRCGAESTKPFGDAVPRLGALANMLSGPNAQQIGEAVEAFMAADTLTEQAQMLEQNPRLFFSDATDRFLAQALQEFASQPKVRDPLRALWVALRRCQQVGIQAAFEKQGLEDVGHVVTKYVTAETFREKKKIVQRNAFLLDAGVDTYFEALIASAQKNDPNATEILQGHHDLLKLCRQMGIDPAFAELIAKEPEPPPPPPKPKPKPKPKAQDGLDQRLIGNWRNFDRMASGSFSVCSEIYLVLGPDARFTRSSQSWGGGSFHDSMGNWAGMSSVRSGLSPEQRGSWGASNGKLVLKFDSGKVWVYQPYEVHPDSLFFPNEESQRLWKRH